jgi:hypothetical protein
MISYTEQSSNVFEIYANNITTTSYTVTGLVPGTYYKFLVQSRNEISFSPYSAEVTIRAAQIPD